MYKTDRKLARLKQLQFGHKAESLLKRQRFEGALAEDIAVVEQQLDTGLFALKGINFAQQAKW